MHRHTHEPCPPIWVFAGGGALAAIAGYVNAVTLAAGYLPVTHLTGSLSGVSGDIAKGDTADALRLSVIVVAFIAGAMVSGMLIGDARLRGGRPYGIAMVIEAGLLAGAGALLFRSPNVALAMAAAGSGLQNAMAATYGKLILRTTHMTGIATDIGLLLGRYLRGRPTERWKFGLLVLLFVSFAVAGWVGWQAESWLGGPSLYLPAAMVLMMGLGYRVWKRRLAKRD
jgi:uncharacterized membrane protein YoaK (UPF0700 family)